MGLRVWCILPYQRYPPCELTSLCRRSSWYNTNTMSRVIGLNLSCLRPVTAESSVTLPPLFLSFFPSSSLRFPVRLESSLKLLSRGHQGSTRSLLQVFDLWSPLSPPSPHARSPTRPESIVRQRSFFHQGSPCSSEPRERRHTLGEFTN